MAYPMDEANLEPLRVDSNRSLEFSSCGVLPRSNFIFAELSILTGPSRHADAYNLV